MSSKSNSSNSTTNNVSNYNLQGLETNGAVVAGTGNTVTTTDHGAIDGAFGFGEQALEFAGGVVGSNEKVTTYAIDKNSDLAGQTIGFAENAIESSLDFSKDLVTQNATNSANSVAAIRDLTSTLTGADNNESNLKALYVAGAVVSVVGIGMFAMLGARR
ncbi:hypothetical protein [Marinomonas foliarum]|uniref:Uncharacterized protein n=1 Tax=Marinomonas foliarum TaxID=491950 RepID=A0A369ACG7_9GAMM|nr:hypothetical protein [Marinomonas foliarum]RCX07052.1 hypothetical protein DFP77_107152 [Marinomonas foliarum]